MIIPNIRENKKCSKPPTSKSCVNNSKKTGCLRLLILDHLDRSETMSIAWGGIGLWTFTGTWRRGWHSSVQMVQIWRRRPSSEPSVGAPYILRVDQGDESIIAEDWSLQFNELKLTKATRHQMDSQMDHTNPASLERYRLSILLVLFINIHVPQFCLAFMWWKKLYVILYDLNSFLLRWAGLETQTGFAFTCSFTEIKTYRCLNLVIRCERDFD